MQQPAALLAATQDGRSGVEAVAFAVMDPSAVTGHSFPDPDEAAADRSALYRDVLAGRVRGGTADDHPCGKSESQRCGNFEHWADLEQHPDVVGYARIASTSKHGGQALANAVEVVASPDGRLAHALLRYPAGPLGNAPKWLPAQARTKDGKPPSSSSKVLEEVEVRLEVENAARRRDGRSATTVRPDQAASASEREKVLAPRLSYGQPRMIEIPPGRCFYSVDLPDNFKLQSRGGAAELRARVVARCRVVSFMALSRMGLAPGPEDSVREWIDEREDDLLLGEGAAITAGYTYEPSRIPPTRIARVTPPDPQQVARVQGARV